MYSRFKALKEFSKNDQERLENSVAAVVGLGATGSVIAENLARHGVKLILIDRDYLEEKDVYSSNIYTSEQCENSLPKARAAEKYFSKFSEVEAEVASLNPENVSILEPADVILDGTDNLETRLLISEYSQKREIPWIYTAAIAEKGYSMFFDDKCFNCIFKSIDAENLETCETAGIMRETAGIAGLRSSKKAVEYLTGKKMEEMLDIIHTGENLDVESEGCSVCEGEDYDRLNSERQVSAVCGKNKFQLEKNVSEKSFQKLREVGDVLAENDYLLRVEIEGRSFTLFKSGRAIIEAEDRGHAEQIFSEITGI